MHEAVKMRIEFSLEKLKRRANSEDLEVDGRKLKCICWKPRLDPSGLGYGPEVGSFKHTNKLSGSLKDEEFFFDKLSDC
jgi:hypothetical protein